MSQQQADTLSPGTSRAELDEALFVPRAYREPVEDGPSYAEPVPLPTASSTGCGTLDTEDLPAAPLPAEGYEYQDEPAGLAVQCGGGSYHLADVAPGVFEMREAVEEQAVPSNEVPAPAFVPKLATLGDLSVQAGDSAALTGEVLTLTGAAPPVIDLMLMSPPAQGTLLREGFALTGGDIFTQEDIDQSRIAYRHEGTDPGEDSFSVGTPCGAVPAMTVRVYIDPPPHQAPTLAGPGDLSAVREACSVASLGPTFGVAIVAVAGRGEWQRRLSEAGEWTPMGDVQHGKALLLGPDAALRFVPRTGWAGTAKLTYRAWDGSSGSSGEAANLSARLAVGGSTAFSRETATAAAVIQPATEEERPLPPAPWEAPPSARDLTGDGLAVVRLQGEGAWQFSLDNGRSWRDIGPVFHGRARVLRPGDKVRFVPRKGWSGRVSLAGRLWDGRALAAGSAVSLAARSSVGDATPFGETVQVWSWELP